MSGNPKGSPWRNTPRDKRKTKRVEIHLSPAAREKLSRLAAGGPLSVVVERLIRDAEDDMVTSELQTGARQWRVAADKIVASVGGLGARAIGTTKDGLEHHGVLESISDCVGFVLRGDDGKRRMIVTEWERYSSPDPGELRARLVAE